MQSKVASWILQTLVLLQWMSLHQTLNVQLDNTYPIKQPQPVRSARSEGGDIEENKIINSDSDSVASRRWDIVSSSDNNYYSSNPFRLNPRNYRSLRRRPHSRREARDTVNHIKFKVLPRHHDRHHRNDREDVKYMKKADDELFSQWTAWGKCDKQCYQMREKYCEKKQRCGGIKHYEQRSCSKHICYEHNFKDHKFYSYGSSEEYHRRKKKRKKQKHYESDENDNDSDDDHDHHRHTKKTVPEIHEHHVHHNHYEESSAPVISAAPAPIIQALPVPQAPVVQPYPVYHSQPVRLNAYEPAPSYAQTIPVVFRGEADRNEKFVVVKQNVVRKFPKRPQSKPILIQLDDYDNAGSSSPSLSYDDLEDTDGDDGHIVLKVMRQHGDAWKRLGGGNRRIIATGPKGKKIMLEKPTKPAIEKVIKNITTSQSELLKILAASTFDYPHSSREFYSTSTASLLGSEMPVQPITLVASLPEPSTPYRPFVISRGPGTAATPSGQDLDFFKAFMGSTAATPFDAMATTIASNSNQDFELPLGTADPPFIPSDAQTSKKPSVFEFLEAFHKDMAPTATTLYPARRSEQNVTVALDDLLNEYDKSDIPFKKMRMKREIHEDDDDVDVDEDLLEDEDDGEKKPNNLLLKAGPVGKRGKEKAVFEMPRKPEALYSKWSKWSKCTAKCTTRRFKKCRARTLCGNDVIREVAYCYTEASFCQEWINQQMYNNYPPVPVPSTSVVKPHKPGKINRRVDHSANSITSNQISNSINRRGSLLPEFVPKNFECGISAVKPRNNKQAPWNMLRIIGGKTARRGQYPWQVMILNRFKEPFCGGTLISPQWVLSAAHCVRKRLYVRIGEHNLQSTEGSELEFRIQQFIKHPKYDKKTVDSDVAMLRLPKSVEKSNYVGFACLPQRYTQLPVGKICTIIGWGKRRHSDDAGTNLLHEAEVPIISNDDCKSVYYDYTITKNMFCAGHKKGRVDTCAGDSGGPLLCKDTTKANEPWTIYGITSFGDGCGKKNKFGIYTKLANYVDWIWSVVNCDGACRS